MTSAVVPAHAHRAERTRAGGGDLGRRDAVVVIRVHTVEGRLRALLGLCQVDLTWAPMVAMTAVMVAVRPARAVGGGRRMCGRGRRIRRGGEECRAAECECERKHGLHRVACSQRKARGGVAGIGHGSCPSGVGGTGVPVRRVVCAVRAARTLQWGRVDGPATCIADPHAYGEARAIRRDCCVTACRRRPRHSQPLASPRRAARRSARHAARTRANPRAWSR